MNDPHPLFGGELQTITSDDDSWEPREAFAAILWVAAMIMIAIGPAIAIAVWKWAL